MLSIVIVNYHSRSLIEDCLESLARYSFASHEIIVVDNSNEDSISVRQKFPTVQWIPMGYNGGFARANNEGIRLAKHPIVLLLNPDILFKDDSLERCLNQFRLSPYIACGVQLLNPDGSSQISGSFFMRGGLNVLLPLPYTGSFLKWLAIQVKMRKPSIEEVTGVQEVDWINGAFLMVKKEVLPKAGFLDEDFFLYAEEIEWCARLRKQGRLCIYGEEHVIHLQGETANASFGSEGRGYYNLFDRKGRQLMLSNFLRVRKQFGAGIFLFHLALFFLQIPVFFLGWLIQKLLGHKNRYRFHQLKGYIRNYFYVLKHAPLMLRNTPHFYKAI